MTITGQGDISVLQSDGSVLISAAVTEMPQEIAAAAPVQLRFDDMFMRIEARPEEEAGMVMVMNLTYWYHRVTANDSGAGLGPLTWPDSGIVIPTGFEGVLFFYLGLDPTDPAIQYAESLPLANEDLYVRPLANVSREAGSDTVTIEQRCFGLITVPSVGGSISFGLF